MKIRESWEKFERVCKSLRKFMKAREKVRESDWKFMKVRKVDSPKFRC